MTEEAGFPAVVPGGAVVPTERDVVADELAAMGDILKLLAALPKPSQRRVLDYVLSVSYGTTQPVGADMSVRYAIKGGSDLMQSSGESSKKPDSIPADLAELFSLAQPMTDYEKALVVAFHLAHNQGEDEFDSFRINSALTHLGHRVGNITRALDSLVAQKPAPVVQTRKEGRTKQARKKFRLTVEGRRRVEQMLASPFSL